MRPLNRDPLFPHLCPGWNGDVTDCGCAICAWLLRRESDDQFYRERNLIAVAKMRAKVLDNPKGIANTQSAFKRAAVEAGNSDNSPNPTTAESRGGGCV